MKNNQTCLEIAQENWDPIVPDFIIRLATFCDENTQTAAAKKIDYSSAVVSQLLRNKYGGNMEKVETKVTNIFRNKFAECPLLGRIPIDICLAHARKPYTPLNPILIAQFKACRQCPNNLTKGE